MTEEPVKCLAEKNGVSKIIVKSAKNCSEECVSYRECYAGMLRAK